MGWFQSFQKTPVLYSGIFFSPFLGPGHRGGLPEHSLWLAGDSIDAQFWAYHAQNIQHKVGLSGPPWSILYISKIISKGKEIVMRKGGCPEKSICKIVLAPFWGITLELEEVGWERWVGWQGRRDNKYSVPFWSPHFLSVPSFPRNSQHSTSTPTKIK